MDEVETHRFHCDECEEMYKKVRGEFPERGNLPVEPDALTPRDLQTMDEATKQAHATMAVFRWVNEHYHCALIGQAYDAQDKKDVMEFASWFADVMMRVQGGRP